MLRAQLPADVVVVRVIVANRDGAGWPAEGWGAFDPAPLDALCSSESRRLARRGVRGQLHAQEWLPLTPPLLNRARSRGSNCSAPAAASSTARAAQHGLRTGRNLAEPASPQDRSARRESCCGTSWQQ